MEIRRLKLIANERKSGTGGTTFRTTIPSQWVRKMGLNEEIRDLKLIFDGKDIRIINNIREVEILNKLLSIAKTQLEQSGNQLGDIDKYLKKLSQKLVEEEIEQCNDIEFYCEKKEYIRDLSEELLKKIKDDIITSFK